MKTPSPPPLSNPLAQRPLLPSEKRPVRKPPDRTPVLRFTPTAWAKLVFFCHAGDTEIGGFGISHPEDLLLIEDFATISQKTTSVTVAFDDAAVADFYEEQVDAGRHPAQFSRIWLHTHPGTSASPSSVDEDTFARCFGGCDWAVMAILAKGGQTYARLRFNVGPGGSLLIPVEVDYTACFAGSDHAAWQAEYDAHVHAESFLTPLPSMSPERPSLLRRRLHNDTLGGPWAAEDLMAMLAGEDLAAYDFE